MKLGAPSFSPECHHLLGADHIQYRSVKRRSYDNAVCEGALADHNLEVQTVVNYNFNLVYRSVDSITSHLGSLDAILVRVGRGSAPSLAPEPATRCDASVLNENAGPAMSRGRRSIQCRDNDAAMLS
jgi:hypothetical protein